MEKLKFKKILYINITRKCNRNCIHCKNGKPEDQSISNEAIDALLDQTSYIWNLYFSGGEPLLALNRIRYVLDGIRERGIVVEKVRVVTNGTIRSEEYCNLFHEFKEYTVHKNAVTKISNDPFHDSSQSSGALDYYKNYDCNPILGANDFLMPVGNAVRNWAQIQKKAENFSGEIILLPRAPICFRVPYYRNNINHPIVVTTIGNIYGSDMVTYKEDDSNSYRICNVNDNILKSIKTWNKLDQVTQYTRLRDIAKKILDRVESWEKNPINRLLPVVVRRHMYNIYWDTLEAEKILKECEPYFNDDNRKFFDSIYKLLENKETFKEAYFKFFDENGKPI